MSKTRHSINRGRSHSWLLLLLLALMAAGCSKSAARQQATTGQKPAEPVLLFQKTPCLGLCPAYNATIYQNGQVAYVPFRNALAQDTLQLQLTPQEVQQFTQKLNDLAYTTLQKSYLSDWSDISSTYLTFYAQGKQTKRVKHEEGGPERLIQFIAWLDELLQRHAKDKSNPTY
ncbi:DUF6438 domain-containing protein [Pontibacter sp. E15-1]|uniref:DUF6438 domain-containing protein n=1 Tax=Pontibacter sp. E15-1 TaxID=2919918 RepID=UPI001F4F5EA0|nr:DUF6438 domain-containing protein [Pontibacter sp. E15-1]MCJ8167079.1 DUF6438 domain-containing protein [Pontibacter sp. E15-1]